MLKVMAAIIVMSLLYSSLGSASEKTPKISFEEGKKDVLVVKLLKAIDKTKNECSDRDACRELYSVEYVGVDKAPKIPEVIAATVSSSGHNVALAFDSDFDSLDSLRLTFKRIQPPSGKAYRKELMLQPSVYLDSGSADSIVYQGRFRLTEVPKKEAVTVEVTATDEETDESTDFKVRVISVDHFSSRVVGADNLWLIKVAPSLPRGKTVDISVSGIDSFDGKTFLSGAGEDTVEGYPTGRDDADYYLNGQYIFNQVEKDQGSIDFKVEKHFFVPASALDWWYRVEGTVGSKSLDISQTGTVAGGRTWWWTSTTKTKDDTSWGLSLAPTFRTDRDFKNRDLGADLTLKTTFGVFNHTIKEERKTTPAILFGWSFIPKIAIESGEHLASSSAEVDGKGFGRGVANANLMFERAHVILPFATLRLTIDGTARYLFQDEVLSDSGSIVKTDKGYVPYLKAELAYDLGPVAVSIVHENGRLPPDFKRAHATTVGVTVKF